MCRKYFSETLPILKLSYNFDSNYLVTKAKRDWTSVSMICGIWKYLTVSLCKRISPGISIWKVVSGFAFVFLFVKSYVGNNKWYSGYCLHQYHSVNFVVNFNVKSSSQVGSHDIT